VIYKIVGVPILKPWSFSIYDISGMSQLLVEAMREFKKVKKTMLHRNGSRYSSLEQPKLWRVLSLNSKKVVPLRRGTRRLFDYETEEHKKEDFSAQLDNLWGNWSLSLQAFNGHLDETNTLPQNTTVNASKVLDSEPDVHSLLNIFVLCALVTSFVVMFVLARRHISNAANKTPQSDKI
jgi:hypothetical protein